MTPLRVLVDDTSGVPPWRQVRNQLTGLIGSGALAAGTRLPTVRQFARDLGLAPGTIARAYRELEQSGLIVTARARGTVVADARVPTAPLDPLAELAHAYLGQARALGADPATAIAAVSRAARG